MKRELPDLPGWSFEIDEESAGVYRVTARAKDGQTFEMKGSGEESMLSEHRQEAAALSERAQFERP